MYPLDSLEGESVLFRSGGESSLRTCLVEAELDVFIVSLSSDWECQSAPLVMDESCFNRFVEDGEY